MERGSNEKEGKNEDRSVCIPPKRYGGYPVIRMKKKRKRQIDWWAGQGG
jgi:hypothetical protein